MPHFRSSTALAAALATLLCSCAATGGAPRSPAPAPGSTPNSGNAVVSAVLVAAAASAAGPAASGASAPTAHVLTTRSGQQVLMLPVGASPAATPAFAAVTKDAQRIDGMLTLWQKEDKVWIELKPDDFNKPMFFSPKISQGLGEPGYFGGTMLSRYAAWGGPQVVEFRRIHNLVQLIARNEIFHADASTPGGYAVETGYSPSLIGSTPVASQPAPDSKSVLVEANALFLADTAGMALRLQQTFRQNYAFDARNSFFDYVRANKDEVVFDVSAHYQTPNIATPAPNAAAGTPVPTLPSYLPDARSLFLGLHYSLARLPAKPMTPRPADPRVGYFTTTRADYTDDLSRSPRQFYVTRWRLDKKDPAAPLSEPVRPITYWLDRTIPFKYRGAITRGILEWNKAFERIGFKDAIVVKVQPDDADFDTLDVGTASVRWMVNADPAFAGIGQHQMDPRTGEILDADIALESLSFRNLRSQRRQVLDTATGFDWPALLQTPVLAPPDGGPAGPDRRERQACRVGDYASEELGYALDVLESRGEMDPDSPQAQAWVEAYLTDVAMHETGHSLGLRHNFRASRLYTDAQLSDPAFTRTHALGASVMDYVPVNLPLQGTVGGSPFTQTLGPYDYWAIEYAYKPLPAGQTPAQDKAALLEIAARGSDPALEFGTDEDNFLGVDPESLQFDLGDDPVAFARKRFAIAHEIFQRQETRPLKPTEDYMVLRRSVSYALRDATRAAGVLLRQLGGVATLRDFPGSGRDPMQPVPAPVQHAALDALVAGVLAPETFQISPGLQRRLAPDFLERGDVSAGGDPVSTDYPVETVMLDFQRQVLGALMSDALAQRLEDSAPKLDQPAGALMPAEVYARVTRTLWTDPANFGGEGARAQGDIPARRRELQRDHVNRLATVLLRTPGGVRVDMRASLRAEAATVLAAIRAAQRRPGLSESSRLHLADCAETLRLAMAAPMQRAGY